MKNFLKTLTALSMIVFIMAISVITGFAETNLTVNGIEGVKKGDKVSYSLYLGDCEEGIAGFHMYIYYDQEYLEVVEDTLNFNELDGQVVYNEKSEDGIIFNFSNVSDLGDFSTEKLFATVDFEVLKGGETEISFFVTELYGMDMTYLKSYTFTYDLAVNGQQEINHSAPIITTEQEFIDKNQGQFINYADGKGQANGGEDGQRETILGSTAAPTKLSVQDVTKGEDGSDSTTPIVIAVVTLLVLAIVAIIIVRNALMRGKKENETQQ